jgi:branched-chain amino acid aminotransferase
MLKKGGTAEETFRPFGRRVFLYIYIHYGRREWKVNRIIFMNGRLVPEKEAVVSVFDHGYLYGDGVFEGIRAYNGRVFRLEEHTSRLFDSAKSIMLNIPYSVQEMNRAIIDTVKANKLQDAYIRVVVSRGKGDLGLDPRKCKEAQVVIIADKIALYPEELYEKGLNVVTVATRRNMADALDPKIKSLNYLNNILAKIEANRAGVLEALMISGQGYICEGTGDNIFIHRKGKLITPPPYLGILEGVTRAVILEIAEEENIPFQEAPFTRHDLYTADECFLSGTAAELIPVIEADMRVIGTGEPGPVTGRLIKRFRERTSSEGTPVA